MSVKERIEAKLSAALRPAFLDVEDESAAHAGHVGAASFTGGETHFRVRIISAAFAGKSRVERHRAVTGALAEEIAGPIHAISIEARAPGEI